MQPTGAASCTREAIATFHVIFTTAGSIVECDVDAMDAVEAAQADRADAPHDGAITHLLVRLLRGDHLETR
ncbi:hypothetical protein ATK30_0209 [Amycolatopsis echigonensis]|uniref:Uncharacterized protein n=1 Tax=Amycolatopsis echigonensis TaxID=2576905 RepID=A0A2N3X1Z8_9PSEU|nr:hypothetical protein [Amycolatopsis niigatensis]PKW00125.1 hypothetical protein ATK30_0209 [Amycolatopsis niigatensis]